MFKAALSTLVLLAASTSFAQNSTYLCSNPSAAGSPRLKLEITRNNKFSGIILSGEEHGTFVKLASADASFQNPENIVRDAYTLVSPSSGKFDISNNMVDYFAAQNGRIVMESTGTRYICQGI